MCGYGKGRSGRSLPRRESLLSPGARDGAKRNARWWHLLSPLSKRICSHREHTPGAAPQSAPSPLLTPIAKDFLSRRGRGRRPVPKRDSAAFTSHADENVSQRRARAVEKQGSGSSEEYSCSCLTDAEVRRPGVRTHVSSGKSRRQWGGGRHRHIRSVTRSLLDTSRARHRGDEVRCGPGPHGIYIARQTQSISWQS